MYILGEEEGNKGIAVYSPLRNVRRKYHRYRSDSRYDSPMLIFFCDVGISIGKLMFYTMLALVAWWFVSRFAG